MIKEEIQPSALTKFNANLDGTGAKFYIRLVYFLPGGGYSVQMTTDGVNYGSIEPLLITVPHGIKSYTIAVDGGAWPYVTKS